MGDSFIGFLVMAYDEGFQVNKELVGVVRPLLGDGNLSFFITHGLFLLYLLFLFFCCISIKFPDYH